MHRPHPLATSGEEVSSEVIILSDEEEGSALLGRRRLAPALHSGISGLHHSSTYPPYPSSLHSSSSLSNAKSASSMVAPMLHGGVGPTENIRGDTAAGNGGHQYHHSHLHHQNSNMSLPRFPSPTAVHPQQQPYAYSSNTNNNNNNRENLLSNNSSSTFRDLHPLHSNNSTSSNSASSHHQQWMREREAPFPYQDQQTQHHQLGSAKSTYAAPPTSIRNMHHSDHSHPSSLLPKSTSLDHDVIAPIIHPRGDHHHHHHYQAPMELPFPGNGGPPAGGGNLVDKFLMFGENLATNRPEPPFPAPPIASTLPPPFPHSSTSAFKSRNAPHRPPSYYDEEMPDERLPPQYDATHSPIKSKSSSFGNFHSSNSASQQPLWFENQHPKTRPPERIKADKRYPQPFPGYMNSEYGHSSSSHHPSHLIHTPNMAREFSEPSPSPHSSSSHPFHPSYTPSSSLHPSHSYQPHVTHHHEPHYPFVDTAAPSMPSRIPMDVPSPRSSSFTISSLHKEDQFAEPQPQQQPQQQQKKVSKPKAKGSEKLNAATAPQTNLPAPAVSPKKKQPKKTGGAKKTAKGSKKQNAQSAPEQSSGAHLQNSDELPAPITRKSKPRTKKTEIVSASDEQAANDESAPRRSSRRVTRKQNKYSSATPEELAEATGLIPPEIMTPPAPKRTKKRSPTSARQQDSTAQEQSQRKNKNAVEEKQEEAEDDDDEEEQVSEPENEEDLQIFEKETVEAEDASVKRYGDNFVFSSKGIELLSSTADLMVNAKEYIKLEMQKRLNPNAQIPPPNETETTDVNVEKVDIEGANGKRRTVNHILQTLGRRGCKIIKRQRFEGTVYSHVANMNLEEFVGNEMVELNLYNCLLHHDKKRKVPSRSEVLFQPEQHVSATSSSSATLPSTASASSSSTSNSQRPKKLSQKQKYIVRLVKRRSALKNQMLKGPGVDLYEALCASDINKISEQSLELEASSKKPIATTSFEGENYVSSPEKKVIIEASPSTVPASFIFGDGHLLPSSVVTEQLIQQTSSPRSKTKIYRLNPFKISQVYSLNRNEVKQDIRSITGLNNISTTNNSANNISVTPPSAGSPPSSASSSSSNGSMHVNTQVKVNTEEGRTELDTKKEENSSFKTSPVKKEEHNEEMEDKKSPTEEKQESDEQTDKQDDKEEEPSDQNEEEEDDDDESYNQRSTRSGRSKVKRSSSKSSNAVRVRRKITRAKDGGLVSQDLRPRAYNTRSTEKKLKQIEYNEEEEQMDEDSPRNKKRRTSEEDEDVSEEEEIRPKKRRPRNAIQDEDK